jgi:hypothetical protein
MRLGGERFKLGSFGQPQNLVASSFWHANHFTSVFYSGSGRRENWVRLAKLPSFAHDTFPHFAADRFGLQWLGLDWIRPEQAGLKDGQSHFPSAHSPLSTNHFPQMSKSTAHVLARHLAAPKRGEDGSLSGSSRGAQSYISTIVW